MVVLVNFQLQVWLLGRNIGSEVTCTLLGPVHWHANTHSHAHRQHSCISEGLIGCVCHPSVWCSSDSVICCHGNAVACLLLWRTSHFITFATIISTIMWAAGENVLKRIRSALNWCQFDRHQSASAWIWINVGSTVENKEIMHVFWLDFFFLE